MRIRNRLIHLLGGYTREDISKKCFVTASEHNVRTLKAKLVINDLRRMPSESFTKNELMARLANQILEEGLVAFSTSAHDTGESDYPQDVNAIIKVVEPSDEGWGTFRIDEQTYHSSADD
jgi:hypothetical protein